ncbi:DUF4231 domain-containing protein [candidate division KSB1 bacterium]|nr:DUF4231 domain-containing protein [candidate division KSB1 bacterium]
MDSTQFEEYLQKRFEDQVAWYDSKAGRNQKIYKRFQWFLIVLSALTPVLVAINHPVSRWPAVVISALVAILTTALQTFRYQEHWLNYRMTCELLRREKVYYDAGVGDYSSSRNKNRLFVERAETLMAQENKAWLAVARQKAKEPEEETPVSEDDAGDSA